MSAIAVMVYCRNAGRALQGTLDSVGHQTRPPAEVVVVDDGSVDLFTLQEIARLSRKGIAILRTASCGPAAARNRAIRATRSSYICALDAGDVLGPTCLEAAAAMLDAEPDVALAGSAAQSARALDEILKALDELEKAFASGGAPRFALFRRELWNALDGYDEALSGSEHFDFRVRAIDKGFRCATLKEPSLLDRVGDGAMPHQAAHREAQVEDMLAIYQKHRHIIERLGPSLVASRETVLESRRQSLATLKARVSSVSSDLRHLDAEISEMRTALAERGAPSLDWGELRRTRPLSEIWGLDRGKPLDRYYIEKFLDTYRDDIRGRVLEIKDDGYARMFGDDAVARVDVLDVNAANPKATIVADLSAAGAIGSASFDCFILTQTLHIIENFRAALAECARALAPGGVLLCTVPAVSRISYEDGGRDGDYWRFTEASIRVLFAELFGIDRFTISGYGNVLACTGFLYGLAPDELTAAELDDYDPSFPLIFGIRAQKADA